MVVVTPITRMPRITMTSGDIIIKPVMTTVGVIMVDSMAGAIPGTADPMRPRLCHAPVPAGNSSNRIG